MVAATKTRPRTAKRTVARPTAARPAVAKPTGPAAGEPDGAARTGGSGPVGSGGGSGSGGVPRSSGGGLRGRSRSLLGQLGPRGRFGMAVAAAIIIGLVGFAIGMNVGRPNYPGEGSADVGFARDMASHHAQAVEMGMMAVQKATDHRVQSLGHDIATTQQAQIGRMYSWLDTWGVPRYANDPPMAWVPGGDAMVKGNLMPGMATREEINQLRAAEGQDFDILFLQLMIRHHMGGVHMVDAVLDQNPTQPVRELAEQMMRNQGNEVVVMQNLLAEFGASPLPN
jgi:Uncharacterized protein conserved in bacteria